MQCRHERAVMPTAAVALGIRAVMGAGRYGEWGAAAQAKSIRIFSVSALSPAGKLIRWRVDALDLVGGRRGRRLRGRKTCASAHGTCRLAYHPSRNSGNFDGRFGEMGEMARSARRLHHRSAQTGTAFMGADENRRHWALLS